MKRATFAGAEPEEEEAGRGELAVAASPHHRLHQPSRSCLKEHHQDTLSEQQRASSSSSSSSSSTTASPLSSLHHHHHHVQFLSNSGTTIGGPQTAPTTSNQLVVIDLNKLRPSSQGALSFRPVPFGMLRARHTYATRFAVVGGNGRTLVDSVAENIASEVSVCKEPASDAAATAAGEMFEVIFRPLSRGPFEGVFHLWVEGTAGGGGRGGSSTFVRTESHDMGREEEEEDEAEKQESAGDAKKRKMEPSSPHRYRLEVVITAQILRKGMGKPSLREGVRCIAIDDEEDSDADSDGWAGF